jgi:hypothetical protein
VSEVGDGLRPKRALGALDKELVLVQNVEDSADMTQVLGPRAAEDEDVVEEDEDEGAQDGTEHVVH